MRLGLQLAGIVLFLLVSGQVQAHVKWFVEFDIADAPLTFMKVVNPLLLGMLLLSGAGIFVGRYIDTLWSAHSSFSLLPHLKTEYPDLPRAILRVGTGAFFLALWLIGNTTLTPELTTDNPVIPMVQLGIAIATFFRGLFPLVGMGVLGLYGYAISQYGLFHMLDYAFFVGLGCYFLISYLNIRVLNPWRITLFRLLVGFSFMWSAMEKIAYPQWFDPFLDMYPFLQMGFSREFFLTSAACVELVLFYMVMRYNNGAALIALLANLLVMSGNIYFGKIDALGHFPANMMLLAITLVGNNKRSGWNKRVISLWREQHQSFWIKPVMIYAAHEVWRFLLTCSVILGLYYAIHWLEYGC